MKRKLLYITLICLSIVPTLMKAQSPVSAKIVHDDETERIMLVETSALYELEQSYKHQLDSIRNAYALSLASASAIFSTKFLDRKAYTNLSAWKSSQENYYYRHIRNTVQNRIIPYTYEIGKKMVKDPATAIYWGPYIYRVCEDTKNLCYEFESIVTNSTIGFSDINFLEVNPQLHDLFRLSQIGGQDWKKVLQEFSVKDAAYSKEGIKSALDNLTNIAKNIPNTVATNIEQSVLSGTDFDGNLIDKIQSVQKISDNVQQLYNNLSTNSVKTFQSLTGLDGDVTKFLVVAPYDAKSWANDYVREAVLQQYYTQRWYIYTYSLGSKVTHVYQPDRKKYLEKPWQGFKTKNGVLTLTATDQQHLRSLADSWSGWSQLKVDNLNKSNDLYHYEISYKLWQQPYEEAATSGWIAAAYAVYVSEQKQTKTIVYDEVFDSRTTDWKTFEASLNAKLANYNNNTSGKIYYIVSEEKKYYEAAVEKQMTDCEKVVFTVNCTSEKDLSNGKSYYPCGKATDHLIPHCKECAYSDAAELLEMNAELDEQLQPYRQQLEEIDQRIEGYTNLILQLEDANRVLEAKIQTASINDIEEYKRQIADNNRQISVLQELLNKAIAEREALLAELAKFDDFIADNEDWYKQANHNRLSGIMDEQAALYNIEWQSNGFWNDSYTFTRLGNFRDGTGTVTFTAQLSLYRKRLDIFGINIRFATIQIDWQLRGTINNTSIADILEFDSSTSDQEKAKRVNDRRSELIKENPDCIVDVDYIKNVPVEEDNTEDTYHLLWASDRLDIARKIDAQLMTTYADLIILNKMLDYRFTLQTLKNAALQQIDFEQGKKKNIVEESLGRWSDSASGKKTDKK